MGRKLWNSRGLESVEHGALNSESSGPRFHGSLQHICHLLSLIFPEDAIRFSFRALQSKDALVRGTALEYLDAILPVSIREKLWNLLEETKAPQRSSNPDPETALKSLLLVRSRLHPATDVDRASD